MFLLTIKSRSNPDNTEIDSNLGGACVNVWVNFPEQEAADVVARYYLSDAGWLPELTIDTAWVTEESYQNYDEDYQYFLEALENGSSLVFNTWPKDAEDSDVD